MERAIKNYILEDLKEKIVLLSGPRQSGKTTLSRMLVADHEYFNYDLAEDRLPLSEKSWRRDCGLLVLDELHKMNGWKGWLKGVYDTRGVKPPIIVTGSARLDTARKVGDSMAGRFHLHRLHPFDVKEVAGEMEPSEALDRLMHFGGFPEPFIKGEEVFYNRWRKSHLDIILRQDLLDLESVRNIGALETMLELLRDRVGSPISYKSLSEDLSRDPKTIKQWLELLENMFVIFKVTPYHRNIARSLLKEPKYYFYDAGRVRGDGGARFENVVACALKKELDFLEDTRGHDVALNYLRDKDGREIDFVPVVDGKPAAMIEAKLGDGSPVKGFGAFSRYLPGARMVQVVKDLDREASYESGPEVKRAAGWLAKLDLETGG
jgi:predicted AAA+ superfamily ATPase